jgi:tight adherence protein C
VPPATLLAAAAGCAVMLFVLGLVRPNPRSAVRRRLEELGQATPQRASDSLARRTFVPLGRRTGRWIGSYLPGGLRRRVAAQLDMAGRRISPGRFITWWAALGGLLPVFAVLATMAAGGEPTTRSLFALAAWAAAGTALPWMWLRRLARKRIHAIDRGLSDAMDLIVTNVEAGVGLQAALINVAQKSVGPIAEEFNRLIREVSLGRSNQEALDAMSRRSGSRELALLARSIAQAERNGIPIGRVLRSHAEELRERRRQLAREKANTLPLRITLLTVAFIFPTLFLLILGPVLLNVLSYFKH